MPKQMADAPTGEEIRKARIDKGLSVLKLANLADVEWRTLRDWEEGKRKPRFETMKRIIEALNRETGLPGLGQQPQA